MGSVRSPYPFETPTFFLVVATLSPVTRSSSGKTILLLLVFVLVVMSAGAGGPPSTLSEIASAATAAEAAGNTAQSVAAPKFQLPVFHCATSAGRPLCWAMDLKNCKILHLIRHAQSTSNVAAAIRGPSAYSDPALHDARLDQAGTRQAVELGQQLRRDEVIIDLVLVSPMTRALETAFSIWPSGTPSPPLIACEFLREAFGAHPCDSRRSITELKCEFGATRVDFSHIGTNEDTWASPTTRERIVDVAVRCDKLLAELQLRPERHIALISHGVLLEVLLSRSGLVRLRSLPSFLPTTQGEFFTPPHPPILPPQACVSEEVRMRRFENAEVRSVVIGAFATPSSTKRRGSSA